MIPFGFTEADASIIGGIVVVAGFFGSFLLGFILTKTKRYRLICIIIGFILAGSLGLLMLFIRTN